LEEIWGETSLVTYRGNMVASTSTTLQLVRILDMRCHRRFGWRKTSGDWVEGSDDGGKEKYIYKKQKENVCIGSFNPLGINIIHLKNTLCIL